MSNLLSKPLIAAKDVNKSVAVLYLVGGNKDYQITVETLLSLISKADLGLDKVDNTPDIEKPISQSVAQALAAKAATNHQHAISDIQGLSDTLSRYVTQDSLNLVIGNLQQLLGDTMSKDAFNIYAAGISQTLQQIQQADTAMSSRIKALEDAGLGDYVTNSAFNSAVNSLTSSFNQQVAAINQALASKADKVHGHTVSEITDFTQAVTAIINQSGINNFADGPNDW